MRAKDRKGIGEFIDNVLSIKDSFIGSVAKGGKPISSRSKIAAMMNNVFLHIQSARVHKNSLRPAYTVGLGLISFFLLIITVISGALLMVYYSPSVENAYNSVKDINYVVSFGRLTRNIHKWAGEGMIIFVLLHMARVFFTSSYKKGREFNWLVGIVLLVLTFFLNFTGYLLPWDQLSYWALVIGSNIAQSPKELTDIFGLTDFFDIGNFQKEIFLGGTVPDKQALIRIYFLHIFLLPLVLFIFLGVHFWRVRKDGGLTVPENYEGGGPVTGQASTLTADENAFSPSKTYGLMAVVRGKTPAVDNDEIENTVLSWPHLLRAEIAVFMLCLAGVVIYSFYVNAPLKELANPMIPENPAKAPWYFLGLQELVSYSAFMGGVGLPAIALLGLALIPYLDREQRHVGIWFTDKPGRWISFITFILGVVVLIGMLSIVVNFGWFRNWWPNIPQLIILLINPGTIWVGFVIVWSLLVIHRTGSTRNGAIAMFILFLVSFVILTYMGTELRGPNWDFYWSKSQWPIH